MKHIERERERVLFSIIKEGYPKTLNINIGPALNI